MRVAEGEPVQHEVWQNTTAQVRISFGGTGDRHHETLLGQQDRQALGAARRRGAQDHRVPRLGQ